MGVLLVAGGVAALLLPLDYWLALVVLFVVGHFFLFCNVLRMARHRELIWAGVFVSLAVCTVEAGVPSWLQTFAASLAATFVLGALELRSPTYHGVFWRQVNPGLGTQSEPSRTVSKS